MGILLDGICPYNMESSVIIDYHCHKFQDVDQHELAAIVAGFELESTPNYFVRETNVPPESLGDKKSSGALQ
jgi:hypothetical protein